MLYRLKSYNESAPVLKGAAVTFGVFDGLHQGHLFEINQTVKDAKANNVQSVLVTFDIDPDELFKKDLIKLMSNEKRIREAQNSNIDHVVIIPFNQDTQKCDAWIFLDNFFGKNKPMSIHVGSNFSFGYKRLGTTDTLKDWGKKNNVKVYVHELVKKDGVAVSSTLLRKAKQELE